MPIHSNHEKPNEKYTTHSRYRIHDISLLILLEEGGCYGHTSNTMHEQTSTPNVV